MTGSARTDRSGQWLNFLLGVVLLYVGADAALDSLSAGHLLFSYRRSVFTGPVAGFLIASFLLVGVGFAGTSIRNLERQ